MKKVTAMFFMIFILEAAGQLVGGITNSFTTNGYDSTPKHPSLSAHEAFIAQGTDPSGMSVSG